MKKEELNKWRESTADEINAKISETENQLYKLKHQLHTGQLKNFSVIKKKRREISILKTLIGEKNARSTEKGGSKKSGKD
ncbi:MAG: 50S ribosomal protein L29 [Candidatus Omnitrophica bacterium]|nr:50S ribosomal protein L29 [Candidatus Omnitrophota bacterium]